MAACFDKPRDSCATPCGPAAEQPRSELRGEWLQNSQLIAGAVRHAVTSAGSPARGTLRGSSGSQRKGAGVHGPISSELHVRGMCARVPTPDEHFRRPKGERHGNARRAKPVPSIWRAERD